MGTVDFPVSTNEIARKHFERGLKLLHHMTYAEADKEFAAAIEADPEFAAGYWGRAMTIVHPVWPDVPSEERLRLGWSLIEEARSASHTSERESDFIETLATYFDHGWEREEKERLEAIDRAWDSLSRKYPEDVEAACFFALFHLAPARFKPSDDSYSSQRLAGSVVEAVLEKIPNHPGALHYQIHAYDFPALADRALEMCASYGDVAPDVPHALHMPTHIFTRAGYWEKSIEYNLKSAEAAKRLHTHDEEMDVPYIHALDYAVYAYLQLGMQDEALRIRDEVFARKGPFISSNKVGGAFAYSSIPARCALETQDWEAAAQLEKRRPEWFPWGDEFLGQESIINFAIAIGGLRSGNLDIAKTEIAEHNAMAVRIAKNFPNTYWDSQARTQQLALLAWLDYREGRPGPAINKMKEATDLENATEKEAVTPGEVLPAGELLGDMLFELERYDEAIDAYQSVLERSPNRFYSLSGIGRAAEANGDSDTARHYYELLTDLSKDANPQNDRVENARRYLASL